VARRAYEDRKAYAAHISWINGPVGGRRRTRRAPRAAAMELGRLEAAQARCTAEEAIDDPVRMAPLLLAGKAVAGEVVQYEPDHRETIGGKNLKRPRVTLHSLDPCAMPIGKHVWWTRAADKREWQVEQIAPAANGGSIVTLVLQTNRALPAGLPAQGTRACFSELKSSAPYELFLPSSVPWTHRPADAVAAAPSTHLEDTVTATQEDAA
jgi:hypothetical protein